MHLIVTAILSNYETEMFFFLESSAVGEFYDSDLYKGNVSQNPGKKVEEQLYRPFSFQKSYLEVKTIIVTGGKS